VQARARGMMGRFYQPSRRSHRDRTCIHTESPESTPTATSRGIASSLKEQNGRLLWRAREREPITGVWGQSPQRGLRGQGPRWEIRGRSLLKLMAF